MNWVQIAAGGIIMLVSAGGAVFGFLIARGGTLP